jgi:hypothetical protein
MVPKFIDLSKHRYLLLQAAEPKIIARITMVATSRHPVVTQFWIHQDFLKCYFISIIIYKNQKYIFLESTASFHKNRFHRVNTGQTMSAK